MEASVESCAGGRTRWEMPKQGYIAHWTADGRKHRFDWPQDSTSGDVQRMNGYESVALWDQFIHEICGIVGAETDVTIASYYWPQGPHSFRLRYDSGVGRAYAVYGGPDFKPDEWPAASTMASLRAGE